MSEYACHGPVAVDLGDDHVALAEIRRPPNNFFDRKLVESLADAFEQLEQEIEERRRTELELLEYEARLRSMSRVKACLFGRPFSMAREKPHPASAIRARAAR